ncbi:MULTISPECIES: ATP-binding protein [unclassified Lentimicrobium]|uniref:ATP-binding protein n=1 Tax=unclassified Lentimicrobium TaxID=2677434 RepID=UPI0015522F13|nr:MULTISPECIES: ATP-binding protein [unclassified Lentimicrobium]NPD46396.1 anti-sigma regulatory factor [Lentimicrobium sp. S6]NPD83582.1 anti-sigma regulatory factor [Lentimicrobium sp. L6]
METLKLKYSIKDGDFSNAGNASSNIKKNLKMLGIDAAVIKKMVVSVYEAEVNMIAHANGGKIEVFIDEEKIKAILADVGPGIPDIDQAMKKGYTTASEEVRQMGFGAGMGLPNIKKNSDDLQIESIVGVGTTLTITSYFKS